jgi:cytochrome b/mono/diheme cytochrome c family protein
VQFPRSIVGPKSQAVITEVELAPASEPHVEATDAPVGHVPGGHVPVWDVAVRVFHWGLVAAVVTAWWTGGSGNRVHEIAGSVVAALIVFRLVWGLTGTPHARFVDFVYHPRNLIQYLQSVRFHRAARHVGHNPAGGAMIVALLVCLTITVVSGFMHLTNRFYGLEWVEKLHHYAANGVLLLVPLHILGVIVSSWMHQENLVRSMLSGEKPVATPNHPEPVETHSEREWFNFRVTGNQGLSTLLFLVAGGLAVGWVLTSGRTTGAAVEATPPPPPATATATATAAAGATVTAARAPAIEVQAPYKTQDHAAHGPEDVSSTWLLASGGRFYDNMFSALGAKVPPTAHPAWPAANTAIAPEDTWRCKSCHGWDYQGRDGLYRTGPNATGIIGVQRVKGRDPAVLMAVFDDATHQYPEEVLPQHARFRLAAFLSRGLHDAPKVILANGRAKGDVAQGKAVFQTVCAACHGFDGRARRLGITADPAFTGQPQFVGTKAVNGPHEVLHKIRNGHPGALMAAMRGFSMDTAGNLLTYAQTLPTR